MLAARVRAQVEADAALATRDRREDLRVRAHRVAAGRLDLQHLGAEIGEDLSGVRHRPVRREVEHAHPVEQPGHRRSLGTRSSGGGGPPGNVKIIIWVANATSVLVSASQSSTSSDA